MRAVVGLETKPIDYTHKPIDYTHKGMAMVKLQTNTTEKKGCSVQKFQPFKDSFAFTREPAWY